MKRWSRVASLCLASAMTMAMPVQAMAASPEFARSAEEWEKLRDNTMEYGELAGLIHEYNVAVQNNQIAFNEKNGKTAEDYAQQYRELADEIESSADDDDASILAAQKRAADLRKQADENVDDKTIVKMDYDRAEAELVVSAQNQMASYQEKLLELQLAEKNREILAINYDSIARQVGQTKTQLDLLTAKEELQTADAAILSAQAAIQNTKQKLCVMLGWNYDSVPEIREIPAADLNRIAAMDPAADKTKALENNYILKNNKRKLENSTSATSKETLALSIKDNQEKIGVTLTTDYQAVLQSKAAYDQAVSEAELEARNTQTAELKYQLGNISKNECIKQQNTYAVKQINLKKADIALFQAMEAYDWDVNGLAAAH